MIRLRIGGVSEHFNFPWHYAISNNYFSDQGIELIWHDYAGGTGAMINALKNNELDMALLLTEGAINGIANGGNFKIVQSYVNSPLIWGIHTSVKNNIASLSELNKMRYAVSKLGSGSHLMAFVHAKEKGQTIAQEQMKVVNDLQGARNSLGLLETDIFFWEKYTTKPFVDSGELKRIGEFPTPWPCFVLVAQNHLLSIYGEMLETIRDTIVQSTKYLTADLGKLADLISLKYNLKNTDSIDWLTTTTWATNSKISEIILNKILIYLSELGMCSSPILAKDLVYDTTMLN